MMQRPADAAAIHGMKPISGPPPDKLEIPHPQPFVCEMTVDRSDLSSTIEHVSNIQYVRWLDRLAELHSDSLGHTRRSLLNQGVMWFVARHEIDYLAEAWLDDELRLATWVRQMRRVKAWRDSVIWRPGDQTVICRASTLWVLVDLATRRPTRIPRSMVRGFDPLETVPSPAATEERPCTLP